MTLDQIFDEYEYGPSEAQPDEAEEPTFHQPKVARKKTRESHVERRIATFRKWLHFWSEEVHVFTKLYGEVPKEEKHRKMLKLAKDGVAKYTSLLNKYKQAHGRYKKRASNGDKRAAAPAPDASGNKSQR